MAENKKSFILYSDIIHTVRKMPKGKQADLFMTILEYVNDENPKVDDLIVGLVWEPIKLQLKRDLRDWEAIKDDRSNGGKLGNLKRWNNDLYDQVLDKKLSIEEAEIIAKNRKASHSDKTASHRVANVAVNDTVTVTVNDTVNKKEEVRAAKAPTVRKIFVPPTNEEAKHFFLSTIGNPKKKDSWPPDKCTNEAETFLDHYIANGWVQKQGKPIKNWQAAARNWIRNGLKGTFEKKDIVFSSGEKSQPLKVVKEAPDKILIEINYLFERYIEDEITVASIGTIHYDYLKKSGLILFSEAEKKKIEKLSKEHIRDKKFIEDEGNITKFMKCFGVLEYFEKLKKEKLSIA